jgi:hypothetical protein
MLRSRVSPAPFAFTALLVLGGCRDLDRFDTGTDGAYCGTIVESDFTRKGFDTLPMLRLTLDIDQLTVAPGTLSSNDPTGLCSPLAQFEQAPLLVTSELYADPLSLLEFGTSREYNFISWVDSTCLGRTMAIVSLMHDDNVEVRLLRPGSPASTSGPDSNEFGVWQLQRDCTTF